MLANGVQRIFTYAGYYSNFFARQIARNIEHLLRTKPQGDGYKPRLDHPRWKK